MNNTLTKFCGNLRSDDRVLVDSLLTPLQLAKWTWWAHNLSNVALGLGSTWSFS
jgi:hypothetical protein